MRRKDRERDSAFGLAVIDHCDYGVVAIHTGEDSPYCLPLSLVRAEDTLYFHSAKVGKKIELLTKNPHVFITFVGENTSAEADFTTYFTSAMVEGTAFEVQDDMEKIQALRLICTRFTPQHMAHFESAIQRSLAVTAIWGIRIHQVTAKEKMKP